ncbi:hypothetical protein NIES4071_63360 [Calothrix sp. NIES-4071]|nr:hypothetical protein NIES4071_63360 [Calothrix sp. NIES-4071]BAZ60639.1 hypothetical protein NIES4105_63310 [Calothrix sp. NIES-4105]
MGVKLPEIAAPIVLILKKWYLSVQTVTIQTFTQMSN